MSRRLRVIVVIGVVALAVPSTVLAQAGGPDVALKKRVVQEVDAQRATLIDLSDQIWRFAETALKETKSSKVLADYAEREGLSRHARRGGTADGVRRRVRPGLASHRHHGRIRRAPGHLAEGPADAGSPGRRRARPRLRPQPVRRRPASGRRSRSSGSSPTASSRERSSSSAPRPRKTWAARSTWRARACSRA